MELFLKIASVLKYKKIGVLLYNKGKENLDISYYQLLKKGGSVDICFSQENIDSTKNIDPIVEKTPNILCLQGLGLVQRIINANTDDITQSIPNINREEYLVQSGNSIENKKLIALYRQEQLNEILDDPELARIPVTGISLGFIGIQHFLQLFEEKRFEFTSGLNTLLIEDERIINLSKSDSTVPVLYHFAEKERTTNEILALCAGLFYFVNRVENEIKTQKIKEQIIEFTAKQTSGYIQKTVGISLFCLLLINFLLFDKYNTKFNQLSIEAQGIIKLQNGITELQNDLALKKQFISQDNIPANYSFAFFADRLASFVDDEIRFIDLSICPVDGKIKDDKAIVFTGNKLVIKGTSPGSAAFSKFLGKVNNASWVASVGKQVYSYNSDNMQAEFELEIILNDANK